MVPSLDQLLDTKTGRANPWVLGYGRNQSGAPSIIEPFDPRRRVGRHASRQRTNAAIEKGHEEQGGLKTVLYNSLAIIDGSC